MNRHEFFMEEVLELAAKGCGTTSPNPMVGALVVKNNRIISKAYHRRAGALHAEALALKRAGKRAKGAELYVNLEPCVHVGRTPPCADAVIKSGIKKVYCAMVDPNPLNNGRGAAKLRKNNIKVSIGVLKKEAERLNRVFIKYITRKIPFVTVKAAQSLDGKIATRTRDSKWITSEAARSRVYHLRANVDAVLVGLNTILEDDPLLTSRRRRSPIKVILDPWLKVPESARIFSKSSPSLSVIAILAEALKDKKVIKKIERLGRKGVLVINCPGKKGKIDLRAFLKELAELEIAHLLVEGGGETIAGFVEAGLADRFLFFMAPKIIGGRGAVTSVEGDGAAKVSQAAALKNMRVSAVGGDILIIGDAK